MFRFDEGRKGSGFNTAVENWLDTNPSERTYDSFIKSKYGVEMQKSTFFSTLSTLLKKKGIQADKKGKKTLHQILTKSEPVKTSVEPSVSQENLGTKKFKDMKYTLRYEEFATGKPAVFDADFSTVFRTNHTDGEEEFGNLVDNYFKYSDSGELEDTAKQIANYLCSISDSKAKFIRPLLLEDKVFSLVFNSFRTDKLLTISLNPNN